MTIIDKFNTQYIKQSEQYIDLLSHLVKNAGSTVEERICKTEEITEAYFAHTGKQMDGVQLERLANLILYDDFADTDRMKARKQEYSVLSEDQYRRRTLDDVSESWAEGSATDGLNYRVQTRDSNRKMRESIGK